MCDPVSATMAGMSAVKMGLDYAGQQSTQDATTDYYNNQISQTNDLNAKQAQNYRKAYDYNIQSLDYLGNVQRQNLLTARNALSQQNTEATSKMQARANEEGVTGNSVNAYLQEMNSKYDVASYHMWNNYLTSNKQLTDQRYNMFLNTNNQINALTNPAAGKYIPSMDMSKSLGNMGDVLGNILVRKDFFGAFDKTTSNYSDLPAGNTYTNTPTNIQNPMGLF